MAPKKKKKPAANPARGFATTSLPSKSKSTDEPAPGSGDGNGGDQKQGPETKLPLESVNQTGNSKTSQQSDQGVDIKDMSPQELEAHLENSELDAILEKYGSRCVNDARRQVARLESERRQLRSQAYKLSTYNWLPDETIDELFDMYSPDSAIKTVTNTPSSGDEKLLVDLWALERVLLSLNFPRVDEAIVYIATLATSGQLTQAGDYMPGLSEALQWYASSADSAEFFNYEHSAGSKLGQSGESTPLQTTSDELRHQLRRNPIASRAIWSPLLQPPLGDLSVNNINPLPLLILPSIPANKTPEPPTASQSRQSPASTPARISEAEEDSSDGLPPSDSEEDEDPSTLTEKYVRYQQMIWDAQNPPTTRTSKRVSKLNEKVGKLRRDPLFDGYEAESAWNGIYIELQATQQQLMREAAARRRKEKDPSAQKSKDPDSEPGKAPVDDNEADEGADGLLGEMFGGAEEALPPEQGQESGIRLMDFGKWTGLSPRKLLDEVCKTHDSKRRIQLRVLHKSSYSARHSLQLSWAIDAIPEDQAVTALPPEVSTNITSRQWNLEMNTIAAASISQSEAYVSTLALSLTSTLGANEQKATARLPTVWRDTLKDLAEAKQRLVNEEHKAGLRQIRALIQETREKVGSQQTQTASKSSANALAVLSDRRRLQRHPTTKWSPEQISQDWNARISRPSFQEMLKVRQQLPVHQFKDRILSCIAENPVSVICAETGAGKSSGIPVLLLEDDFSRGQDARILVTQPRRISAVTLARRVSQELGESRHELGTAKSLVGYAIRLESKTSGTTRITYATTGVLLRMLEESPDLDGLDYLVLDEVHERTMDLDLLFIALRRLLNRRSTLKIVLMSATVDARKFSDYFGGAPVLDLPGRTFPVEVGFLEDAVEATTDLAGLKDKAIINNAEETADLDDFYGSEKGRPVIANPDKYSSQTHHVISGIDEYRIDYNLIAKLVACIANKPQYAKYSSAILIFMPGIGEMRRLHNLLLSMDTFGRSWVVHLLHSTFSTEELERAFERPPPGYRKIVIATNIAETGITIPDVTAVIDTCKEKILRFDERRQLSRLTEGFISRSSARQRRGRAARVQEGLCFHLVTRHRHDTQLLDQQVPEMLRLGLQDPMLRIKVWNLGSIEETLNAAIDPPARKNVLRAIEKLKDAGALTRTEALTPLGHQIARLPLEVSLAKLAIFGVIFKCLDPILAMISLLTSKSPFLTGGSGPTSKPQQQPSDARHAFRRSDSDLLSALNAYEGWRRAKAARQAQEFCRKNHISDQAMAQVEDQKIQLLVYLVDAGVAVLEGEEKSALNRARNSSSWSSSSSFYTLPRRYNSVDISDRTLNALVAMALYPRILTREGKGWRNVTTNQVVSLTSRSVNHHANTTKPPRWLSFHEAMQNSRAGNLQVFETSAVPESALPLVLGGGSGGGSGDSGGDGSAAGAEFKFFAGVLVLDSGKVRLAVRRARELMAIKILRDKVLACLDRCYANPGREVEGQERRWLDLWVTIEAAQEG